MICLKCIICYLQNLSFKIPSDNQLLLFFVTVSGPIEATLPCWWMQSASRCAAKVVSPQELQSLLAPVVPDSAGPNWAFVSTSEMPVN